MSPAETVVFTNCHTHTFTHKHAPDRFVRPPLSYLLRIGVIRRAVLAFAHWFDPKRQGAIGRYAEILETSYGKHQGAVLRTWNSWASVLSRNPSTPNMTSFGLSPRRTRRR